MSNALSALQGAKFDGLVKVADAGLQGMITLRGDFADAKLQAAVKEATGHDLPQQRAMALQGDTGVAWMSPDELLLLVPYAEAHACVARLRAALAGTHHMVENVSDARAFIALSGADGLVREVLAKVVPVDMDPQHMPEGQMRRTKLAQVAAAIWMQAPGEARVVCFRSVGTYAYDVLCTVAAPNSAVGFYAS